MAEAEITALKQALHSQQQLLQKLYAELEAEREASATATSETLSMIWRLQEEKAAEKMEANQYKRIAEEKMKHSEESMAIFHEIMYQKEMEIAALEFQIQAYRYKLMSMGVSELNFSEGMFEGNMFMRQDKLHSGDKDGQGIVRRNKSLPAVEFKDQLSKMGILDRQGTEGLSSYWEQIKQLDERVKALSIGKDVDEGVDFCSDSSNKAVQLGYPEELEISPYNSPVKRDLVRNASRGLTRTRMDYEVSSCSSSQFEDHVNMSEMDDYSIQSTENESIINASQIVSVHDVFEVPQTTEAGKFPKSHKHYRKKLALEGGSRLGKPEPIPQDPIDYCDNDEVMWVKKVPQYSHEEDPLSKPRGTICIHCHSTTVDPKTGTFVAQTEIQELNERLEHLEGESRNLRQEASDSKDEVLRLLKEIHEQLNTIKSEIRDIKTEKCAAPDEPSLVSIMEAMFFYSL